MFPLFAQRNDDDFPDELNAVMVVFICGFVLVALVVGIMFLLTLQRALSRCRPHNRSMEPGMVWLNLIPLFNIVWQFITVSRIAESLKREFRSRGWDRGGVDYGSGVGLASCWLRLCGVIPLIGAVFGLAGFVCGIIYWVKIAGFSGQLASRAYDDGGYGDYDDRDDRDDRDEDRRDRGRDRDRDDRDDGYDDGRPPSRPWDRGGR